MIKMLSRISPTHMSIMITMDGFAFPLGIAECSKYYGRREMYFNRLYVRPECRRKGYGAKMLKRLLDIIKKSQFALQLDINPYGDMGYAELERFYTKYGFRKCKDEDKDGDFYTYYYNKEVLEMDPNLKDFDVNRENVAIVMEEQTFWVGDNADVEVKVNLYEHDGGYQITSWLNGTEELNTIEYEGSLENQEEILAAMEKLVHDNEEYILDVASWND